MKTKINLRIDFELKDQLEILAEEKGISISVLVRDIIYEYFIDHDYEDDDYITVGPPIVLDLSKWLDGRNEDSKASEI